MSQDIHKVSVTTPAKISRSQQLLRLFHTVKYLRPVQLYGRVWFKLNRPKVKDTSALPLRAYSGQLTPAPDRPQAMTGPESFEFLGTAGTCVEAADWNDASMEKLWLYNLHYFDDLTAVGAVDRRDWHSALIARWIQENPVGHGNGWEPYPLSLRIVNQLQWVLNGATAPDGFDASLATQVRYLCKRIEWHLQGNHLFVNGKAILMAGLYFTGPEAEKWQRLGWSILAKELEEEFLSDGAHFELSPMYHSIMLRDLIDLVDFSRLYAGVLEQGFPGAESCLKDVVQQARQWLDGMVHPDGEISLFNDAAIGIAPSPSMVNDYARAVGLPDVQMEWPSLHHFQGSGHVRWSRDGWTAFLDVAAVGPDYLPGHAHADTLTFELSLGDERFIVDSGTGVYGDSPERLRQRGSLAHNVVTVDGEDSSEVWSGFRVARRARAHDVNVCATEPQRVSASHDGYKRLAGKVGVARTWAYQDGCMRIIDSTTGSYGQAVARFHFGEGVVLLAEEDAKFVATTTNGKRVEIQVTQGSAQVLSSTYHPEFGAAIPNQVLEVELEADGSEVLMQLA